MKDTSKKSAESSQVTDFQKDITSKVALIQKKVVKEIILTIIGGRELSPDEFVKIHIKKNAGALPAMSDANSKLFKKIIISIRNEIHRIPSITISFGMLAEFMQDPNVEEKFVESVAYPYVLDLIAYIDKSKKSLMD